MKIRNGFVSNSSSSSFVCAVCKEEASGMDLSLSDADMSQCMRGHEFCNSHMVGEASLEEKKKRLETYINSGEWCKTRYKDFDYSDEEEVENLFEELSIDCGVDAAQCPICSYKNVKESEGFEYLCKMRAQTTDKSLLDELKEKFPDYEDFKKFITPPKKD